MYGSDESASRERRAMYVDGCTPLPASGQRDPMPFIAKLKELSADAGLFQVLEKNTGSPTLKPEIYEERAAFFVDHLFDSGLIQRVIEIVGRPVYLTNLIHMITPGANDGLSWHRDTHVDGATSTGNIPPVLKLMIYASDVGPSDGGLEVLRGTHRIDLHSQRVDKLLALARFRHYAFHGRAGDALLFDTSLVHRRSPNRGGPRLATVYNLATLQGQVEPYRKIARAIPEYYAERLSKL